MPDRYLAAGSLLAFLCMIVVGPLQAQENGLPPRDWLQEWPNTDFSRAEVAFREILSGGPPKDGILAIDDPHFSPVPQGGDLYADREPVMSVRIDGEARAYPLSILMWHEIVNDTLADTPISVTFCPLGNSGIVFDRRVEGIETTFGTTGKLRNSDMVMYDRLTESWWQQFEGRAIIGAKTGVELARLPARLESFGEFAARNPTGRVLVPRDSTIRDYGRNPYVGYDGLPRPFLYDGEYDGPGLPLMRVVSVVGRDEAWSLGLLRQCGEIIVDDLVLRWRSGQASALDRARIDKGRDVGIVTVQRQQAEGGLVDVSYDVPFAFAFRAFHPGAPIHHNAP